MSDDDTGRVAPLLPETPESLRRLGFTMRLPERYERIVSTPAMVVDVLAEARSRKPGITDRAACESAGIALESLKRFESRGTGRLSELRRLLEVFGVKPVTLPSPASMRDGAEP